MVCPSRVLNIEPFIRSQKGPGGDKILSETCASVYLSAALSAWRMPPTPISRRESSSTRWRPCRYCFCKCKNRIKTFVNKEDSCSIGKRYLDDMTCKSWWRGCPAPRPGCTRGQTPAPTPATCSLISLLFLLVLYCVHRDVTPPTSCSPCICSPEESPPKEVESDVFLLNCMSRLLTLPKLLFCLSGALKYFPHLSDGISELFNRDRLWIVNIKYSECPLNLLIEMLCVAQINCLNSLF